MSNSDTVEPLIKDTPRKGQPLYKGQLLPKRGQPPRKRDKMAGPKVSFTQRLHCTSTVTDKDNVHLHVQWNLHIKDILSF